MATPLRFKGAIAVHVDASLLEARLVLTKEGDLEYDEGALVRTLSDAGVVQGYETESLVQAIQAFARSKDTQKEIPAAHGVPPRLPVGETWEWEESLPLLTEAQKSLSVRVLKGAGAPEVFQVRIEKVKVQKVVPGKPGLFGAGQSEVQSVIENREIREKVLVDPNPLRVHWVEAGAKLAVIYPPKPGQPGTNLEGKPIAIPNAKVPSFLVGSNLDKQKAEARAQVSGFLRIGRNWADLVAHRAHRWEVTYSPDKTSAFLTFEPGDASAPAPAAGAILDQLAADGFPADRHPTLESLQSLVDEALRSQRRLDSHPLGGSRDGSFEICFNEDKTAATLDLLKPLGSGQPLSLKDLGLKLREAQLKGFSFDAVKGAIQDFLSGPGLELRGLALAQGQPASPGRELVVAYNMAFVPPDELKAIIESTTSNPRFLESLPDRDRFPLDLVEEAGPVTAGQEFARLEIGNGGAGVDGVDVCGKKIPAPPGKAPPLVLLTNVRQQGNVLVAAVEGLLEVGRIDGVIALRVRPHVDAMAVVHRAEDNLSATLTLVQGRGTGRRLERSLIDKALKSAQILAGLDEAAIAQALEAAAAGAKVEAVEVARGIPAANDLNRRLSFPMPMKVDAKGNRKGLVRSGEVAGTYRPPAEGQVNGLDVLGNPIPAYDGEVRNLVVGEEFSVETTEDGRHVLTALKSGELVFDGETINIISQIAVASVGGAAGNVKFPGEVMVSGAVETGGFVVAGSIKVRGRVGGALLSSDQNIQVADGIHGEGKAVLRAKKHISVGFVERSLVMAVGDVHIGKASLGCTFRVNGKVFQKSPGGGLQGGSAKVRLGLDVMNLGSPSGLTTHVSFGQDYLIEDQIQAEVKETDKLREAIVQLDVLMRKLTGPADKDKLTGARQKKVLMMKMLEKRNLKLINLRDKFDLHVPSEIVVRETLFPGAMVESHGRVYETKSRKTGIRLIFNEKTGHIEESPLN